MNVIGLAGRPDTYAGASMNRADDLIQRARDGEEEAFRLIFERYTRPVISFLFYLVGSFDLAEELAQETFVRAYRQLGSLREEAKLSTWLFAIAKNVAREGARARRKDARRLELSEPSVISLSDDQTSPVKQLLEKELGQVMRAALQALDEDKRLVFTLKTYQQLSYEEIAEITNFSLPKVRNDLHRARAELRRRLGRYLR